MPWDLVAPSVLFCPAPHLTWQIVSLVNVQKTLSSHRIAVFCRHPHVRFCHVDGTIDRDSPAPGRVYQWGAGRASGLHPPRHHVVEPPWKPNSGRMLKHVPFGSLPRLATGSLAVIGGRGMMEMLLRTLAWL